MHDYPELSLAREDMRQQSELYRSSSFRDEASAYLVKELLEGGADQLRSLPTDILLVSLTARAP